MKIYLLLYGAMRGAWLWDEIKPIMEKGGAKVIAYDLPGQRLNCRIRQKETCLSSST